MSNKVKKYDHVIEQYVAKYPNLLDNKTALAQQIIDDAGYEFSSDYFRRFIRDYLERHSVDRPSEDSSEINTNPKKTERQIDLDSIPIPTIADEVPKYEIYKDHYVWQGKSDEFKISVEEADQLFYEYSKYGLNDSMTAVRRRHDIPLPMWHSLKHHLSLYKDSHIISPHTMQSTPDGELQKVVQSRMEAKEFDKERIIIEEHDKATIKEYNRVIKEFKTKDIAIEAMLDEIVEAIDIPEIKLIQSEPLVPGAPSHIMAIVADLHIGAEAKNLLATPDFNYNKLRKLLDSVAQEINAVNAAEVSVMFLGDIIESITGLNHLSTWHGLEDGGWGANVFKMAVEAIIEFLNKIHNLREVFGIAGNHDRTDHDKKVDPYGTVAGMIFYTLSLVYKDSLPIHFHYLLESIERNGINYMIVHGDKPIFKKNSNAAEGVLQYGVPGMFNFVIQGHLHSREIKADHNKYRWIQAPSIFTGNTYSEDNAFHALPGFTIIYNNERTKQPVMIDYTL